MSNSFRRLLWFTFCLISLLLAIFLVVKGPLGERKLVSPIPNQTKVLAVNQWFPQQFDEEVFSGSLQISAKEAFFVETRTGKVLFSKNARQKLPIASLVKVMTALVAAEHKNLDDKLTVSQKAAEMEPDKMLLIPGEKLTVKELLSGIFLISANDAAEVLAENSVGDRKKFIQLMNDKASQLGMKESLFVNPTGLDEDGANSFSTSFDLVLLARYAIRHFPVLVDISQTEHIFIPQTEDHQDYDMYSGINLLTTYPGVVGFKTGYTPEAGLTLITLARRGGFEVLGVILGSEDRRDEAKGLLDFSFQQLGN